MLALGKDFASVTHFVRNLRGGSQPILAQANDGHTYVVKFANNLQGPNLLFNESAGSELYRACGLPVPVWTPLVVSDGFLDRNPGCWIQTPEGRLRPESGLCFGSRFLGEKGERLLEILPSSSFARLRNQTSFWLAWLVDICAEHGDNRQAVFTENSEGWIDATFIDHGHVFGGPKGELKRNFRASGYLDLRIYIEVSSETQLNILNGLCALDIDGLWERIETIPTDWKQKSAFDAVERCLQRLTDRSLIQNVIETIANAVKSKVEMDLGKPANEQIHHNEVLRRGIQGAKSGRHLAHNLACI
jgi:hypothetical protein